MTTDLGFGWPTCKPLLPMPCAMSLCGRHRRREINRQRGPVFPTLGPYWENGLPKTNHEGWLNAVVASKERQRAPRVEGKRVQQAAKSGAVGSFNRLTRYPTL